MSCRDLSICPATNHISAFAGRHFGASHRPHRPGLATHRAGPRTRRAMIRRAPRTGCRPRNPIPDSDLDQASQQLLQVSLQPGVGALLVTISQGRINKFSGDPLLFKEHPNSLPEASREVFSEGEVAEFQSGQLAQAASAYRSLTKNSSITVRAGAWMRLGRVMSKSNDFEAALHAYREASAFKDVSFAGVPVELAARRAACVLFATTNRPKELSTQASSLSKDLTRGNVLSIALSTKPTPPRSPPGPNDRVHWSANPSPQLPTG